MDDWFAVLESSDGAVRHSHGGYFSHARWPKRSPEGAETELLLSRRCPEGIDSMTNPMKENPLGDLFHTPSYGKEPLGGSF